MGRIYCVSIYHHHIYWEGGTISLLIIQHQLYVRAIGIRLPGAFGKFFHKICEVIVSVSIRAGEEISFDIVLRSLKIGIVCIFCHRPANRFYLTIVPRPLLLIDLNFCLNLGCGHSYKSLIL